MHWRRWLHLYNTFQTLTGVLLATTEGLQHHDYETITLAVTKTAGMQPTDAACPRLGRVCSTGYSLRSKLVCTSSWRRMFRHPTRWGMSMRTTAATSMPKPRRLVCRTGGRLNRGPGGIRLHLAGAGMDHRAGSGSMGGYRAREAYYGGSTPMSSKPKVALSQDFFTESSQAPGCGTGESVKMGHPLPD